MVREQSTNKNILAPTCFYSPCSRAAGGGRSVVVRACVCAVFPARFPGPGPASWPAKGGPYLSREDPKVVALGAGAAAVKKEVPERTMHQGNKPTSG